LARCSQGAFYLHKPVKQPATGRYRSWTGVWGLSGQSRPICCPPSSTRAGERTALSTIQPIISAFASLALQFSELDRLGLLADSLRLQTLANSLGYSETPEAKPDMGCVSPVLSAKFAAIMDGDDVRASLSRSLLNVPASSLAWAGRSHRDSHLVLNMTAIVERTGRTAGLDFDEAGIPPACGRLFIPLAGC